MDLFSQNDSEKAICLEYIGGGGGEVALKITTECLTATLLKLLILNQTGILEARNA